jgi:DNA invertase Pin-like site-specific DNA recombinase
MRGGSKMGNQRIFGYARVSTKEQREDRQLAAFREFGIADKFIYVEKQSGKDFNRPIFLRLVKKLKRGDTLVVISIDRLGRNYAEILEQWRVITKVIGAYIVVLDMPLLDTRIKSVDLTGIFVADLVLQILSYVAQTERQNIIKRQAAGIAAAKEKGVRFGRPPKAKPDAFYEYADMWRRGEINDKVAADLLGLSRTTFRRWAENDV